MDVISASSAAINSLIYDKEDCNKCRSVGTKKHITTIGSSLGLYLLLMEIAMGLFMRSPFPF